MAHAFETVSRSKRNGAIRGVKIHADDVITDFAELRKDVSKLADAVRKAARVEAASYRQQVGQLGADLRENAAGRLHDVGDRVRERPVAAMGISVGVGLLLGLALSAKR